jgi:hypothetical protein
MTDPNLIGRSLLKSGYQTISRNTQLDVSIGSEQPITLSEALNTYVMQKGAGKPKTFKAAAQRACTYLVDACGTKDLADYSRAKALMLRFSYK